MAIARASSRSSALSIRNVTLTYGKGEKRVLALDGISFEVEPNEFTVIGNLRYWDRIAELPRIAEPTLITCGRHDELGPVCSATLQQGIPDARTVIFEDSAHCAHIEEAARYLATVREFLGGVEAGA